LTIRPVCSARRGRDASVVPRGARQLHTHEPGLSNRRGASLRSGQSSQCHPARRVRPPFQRALQSITVAPLRQAPPANRFSIFRRRFVAGNSFKLADLPGFVKGRFASFRIPRPARRPFEQEPYNVTLSHSPVNPSPHVAATAVSRGAHMIPPLPSIVNPCP
jgi:hypothetical protein